MNKLTKCKRIKERERAELLRHLFTAQGSAQCIILCSCYVLMKQHTVQKLQLLHIDLKEDNIIAFAVGNFEV